MAATVWKGYITFGLISIPVRLYAAARGERVSFHQIHEKCHTRIKYQYYCPTCDRTVERSELVKGYEVEKDTYVLLADDDLRKIAPQSSDTMEILEFVKLDQVDPIYYETSYYAVPEAAGRRPYQLLLETMERTGHVAIAKISMHRREYTIVIRPRANGLTLHTIYYPNEIREVPDYGRVTDGAPRPQEIQLAEQLIKSLSAPFDPSKYRDEYQQRLLDLIEAKREGKEVRGTPTRKLAPVIDLMEALQRSLSETEKPGRKPAARAQTASKRKKPSRRMAS